MGGPSQLAGLAAGLGAVASAIAGAIQATRPTDTDPLIDGGEHVGLTLVALALVLWIPGYLRLTDGTSRVGRAGGVAAAIGCALLAFGMTATNLHGQDYSWFPAVAVPANLLWLVGSILLAVGTWRARTLPKPLAAALPVIWLTSIILSQLGGNLIAGALWGVLAYRMATARDRVAAQRLG
ncbi:hypothetical protein SAMN05443668_11616 [Cryptosporangium aurantiacum]|uniref:Uncharacterized protein n=1 Tax=Cryptosporangium aurantiacum TaxID=134849 RepID=A0A1M7RK14_9ACTN|nr:hypothetical protein SAMN05443668_11616 [Cryptosporangium aurantiacum]